MSATTTGADLPGPRNRSAGGVYTVLRAVEADMLLEQAKGVLIFHSSVDAPTAQRILERWGVDSGAGLQAVAEALVFQVCQGVDDPSADPWLIRWLEDRLRHGAESSAAAEEPDKKRGDRCGCSSTSPSEAWTRWWRRPGRPAGAPRRRQSSASGCSVGWTSRPK